MTRSNLPLGLLSGLTISLVAGCSSSGGAAPPSSGARRSEAQIDSGLRASEAAVSRPASAGESGIVKPAAVIAGSPVTDAEIKQYTNELAGGVVLEEMAVDRLVRQRCQTQGLVITTADVEAERAMLLDSMSRGAETSAEQTRNLLERVQRQRGLGPKRFAALLERNAMLRKLVAPSVKVSEEQIDQAIAVRYGERRNARIIVRNTQQEAAESIARLQGQTGVALAAAFGDEASRRSIDASSARGGILEPISVADPSYPAIVRTSLTTLTPGELSPIVALDRGFAILLLDSIAPPITPPADARELSRQEVMRRSQRVAMDRLARDLLLTAGITAYDDSLRWSWEHRAESR